MDTGDPFRLIDVLIKHDVPFVIISSTTFPVIRTSLLTSCSARRTNPMAGGSSR
jgi:hypothetical protein